MLLQVFIILSGNYNFFNLLTVTLCLSLLDDRHVYFWLRKAYKTDNGNDGMKLHCTAAAQAMFRRLRRSCLSRRMHILFYLNFLQTKRNIEDKLCSLSLSTVFRLKAVVVAVLPAGAGGLGSADCWNNHLL